MMRGWGVVVGPSSCVASGEAVNGKAGAGGPDAIGSGGVVKCRWCGRLVLVGGLRTRIVECGGRQAILKEN